MEESLWSLTQSSTDWYPNEKCLTEVSNREDLQSTNRISQKRRPIEVAHPQTMWIDKAFYWQKRCFHKEKIVCRTKWYPIGSLAGSASTPAGSLNCESKLNLNNRGLGEEVSIDTRFDDLVFSQYRRTQNRRLACRWRGGSIGGCQTVLLYAADKLRPTSCGRQCRKALEL